MKFEIRRSRRNNKFRSYAIGNNGEIVWVTPDYYERIGKAVHAVRLIDEKAPIDVFDTRGNWTRTIEPQREDVYAQ